MDVFFPDKSWVKLPFRACADGTVLESGLFISQSQFRPFHFGTQATFLSSPSDLLFTQIGAAQRLSCVSKKMAGDVCCVQLTAN